MSKRKVLSQLRQIVKDSKDDSCQLHGFCLYLYDYQQKNECFEWCEAHIINNRLVFIDDCGCKASANSEELETLIDIVEKCTQSK